MKQDEFWTLTGFEEVSFDVADEKCAMAIRHGVSETYSKFSVEYRLEESEKR